MKLPFADLFQKAKGRGAKAAEPKAPTPIPVVRKSKGERLAKTVLPSAARTATSVEEPKTEVAQVRGDEIAQVSNLRATDQGKLQAHPTLGCGEEGNLETCPTMAAPTPPKISMGAMPAVPAPNLPPAVAFALEPNVERAISLPLGDVIAQMPEGYLKPRETLDVNRRVLLKAAEVEKGMASGRPAVAVATLFQQAPDIFIHTVPATDGAMVALPFERVLHELSNLTLRGDQAAEQTVPQVETPFLQAAMEDTERFGTSLPVMPSATENFETEELLPVRIEPATAEAFAAAVPEAKEAAAASVRIEPATTDEALPPVPGTAATKTERAAIRIPFTPAAEPDKFGTGEPAFPRVPASSGPPVPSAPASSSLNAPARIPFSFPAPSDDVWKYAKAQEQSASSQGNNSAADKEETPSSRVAAEDGSRSAPTDGAYHEPIIELPLRPILQNLPPMQLCGNPATVPESARVSFALSTIAPQLASGKVSVTPRAFYAVLPNEYRRFFAPEAADTPVQLPLPDILANLPAEALSVRPDQQLEMPTQVFETPFGAKAAEDAARLSGRAEPLKAESLKLEKPQATPNDVKNIAPSRTAESETKSESSAVPARTASRQAPKFDAKEAIEKACALPGIEACSVIFQDGLSIAGNIPEEMHIDGLSAVAPTLLQRLEKHMLETSLGRPITLTVHGEKAPVTFCAAGNICLTALHRGEVGAVARRELVRIAGEISRAYSETPHVDH